MAETALQSKVESISVPPARVSHRYARREPRESRARIRPGTACLRILGTLGHVCVLPTRGRVLGTGACAHFHGTACHGSNRPRRPYASQIGTSWARRLAHIRESGVLRQLGDAESTDAGVPGIHFRDRCATGVVATPRNGTIPDQVGQSFDHLSGMPAASAKRLLKRSQSSPSLARTCATSNQSFVVGDSDFSFSIFRPALDMMVQ